MVQCGTNERIMCNNDIYESENPCGRNMGFSSIGGNKSIDTF